MHDEVGDLLHEDEVELASVGDPDDNVLAFHLVDVLDEFDDIDEIGAIEDTDEVDDVEPPVAPVTAVLEDDDGEAAAEGELPLDAILFEQEFGAEQDLDEEEAPMEPPAEHWPVVGEGDAPLAAGDEFVCTGCFLVKHRHQLVDVAHQLCADCA